MTDFLLCGHPPAEQNSTSLPSRPPHCDWHLPAMPILNKKSLLCTFAVPSPRVLLPSHGVSAPEHDLYHFKACCLEPLSLPGTEICRFL